MFLQNEMDTIRQRHRMYDLASNWPSGSVLQGLVRRSTGLFIRASIAANFIREGHDPQEQFDILLNVSLHGTAEAALNALYTSSIEKWESVTFTADFHSIMGTVIVGKIPVSDEIVNRLVGLHGRRSSKFCFVLHAVPSHSHSWLHVFTEDWPSVQHM